MNLSIKNTGIQYALSLAETNRASIGRTTLPYPYIAELTFVKDRIKLFHSNTLSQIECTLPNIVSPAVDSSFNIKVPITQLYNLFDIIKNDETITADIDYKLIIKTNTDEFQLPILDSDSPMRIEKNKEIYFNIDLNIPVLTKIIKHANLFASSGDLRTQLTMPQVFLSENNIYASDGKSLFKYHYNDDCIKTKSIKKDDTLYFDKNLINLLQIISENNLNLSMGEMCGDIEYSRIIQDSRADVNIRFSRYNLNRIEFQAAIPKNKTNIADVPIEWLLNVAAKSKKVGCDGKATITIANDYFKISTIPQETRGKETLFSNKGISVQSWLPIKTSREIKLMVNSKYLFNAITAIHDLVPDCKQISFIGESARDPVKIQPAENDNVLIVIMPMHEL
jgi:DNA polymerase III sliding clamp (beta) subunit (PCNA family)